MRADRKNGKVVITYRAVWAFAIFYFIIAFGMIYIVKSEKHNTYLTGFKAGQKSVYDRSNDSTHTPERLIRILNNAVDEANILKAENDSLRQIINSRK